MQELDEGATLVGRALALKLQRYWDSPLARAWHSDRLNDAPMLGSPRDQVPDTDHPYWEVLRWWPMSKLTPGSLSATPHILELPELDRGREALYAAYAYAVPSPRDLDWMVRVLDGRSLVDVFAGRGYWAWQLAQKGVKVVAADANAPERNRQFHHVVRAPIGARITGSVLFICWPPQSGAAAEALDAYEGDTLIYCGEFNGGCHADDDFFAALHRDWRLTSMSPGHVTWDCLNDKLVAFERRGRTFGNLWGLLG